jgi:signal transduction histidine kinase/ActR/RegA family two-component response regulator
MPGAPAIATADGLRRLAETGPDIVARFDRHLRHLYVSPAVEQATGRPASDFVGKTNDEMGMPAEQCALWRAAFTHAFETGEASEIEFEFETPRGCRRFQSRIFPETDGAGNQTLLVVARDVTDGRIAHLLQEAVRYLPAGVALVEAPSGRPLLKNDEADRIFDIAPGAFRLRGVSDYGAYHGFRTDGREYEPADWPLSRSIAAGEVVAGEEAEITRADGSRAFISMTSAPVRDASGRVIAGLVTYYDITATKILQRQLAASERETALLYSLSDAANRGERLEDVFEAALSTILEVLEVDRASILLFDDAGVMRFRAWRRLSEDYRRAVEGHSPWTRDAKQPAPIFVSDTETDDAMAPYRAIFRAEGIRALGFVPLVYGNELVGKFMVYGNEPRPFSERDGALARTVAAQIASAVGRSLAAEALQDSSRRKDEFLAMLSHELRNPLAATRSALALLTQTTPSPEDSRRYMAVIERQTTSLVRIVDDLLDVSRITRGLIELRRENVDLAALVPRAIDTLRTAIDAKGHAVSVTLPHKPVHVDGDPVRLEQVLVNVLTNAVKYTDSSGRITVSLESEDDQAVLRVRDSGIGFEPSLRERIFDLFEQAPTGLDRAQGGLGIGLTIVKRLVELHDGRVVADSDGPGRGSEMTIYLPLATEPSHGVPAATRLHALSPDASRVLVVDDHVDSGQMLVALLESWGHIVSLAQDGPSGLDEALRFRPHVVLLDIGLPGMDGFEVARRLRAPTPGNPLLVALTGYGQESDREKAIRAGFSYHLVKPLSSDQLRAVLDAAASQRERSA